MCTHAKIHTTPNHFTALWTLSGTTRVSRHQKVHFAIFWIFWSKMKITQADAPKIMMDCHPIQTNWCPHLCHPQHLTQDALPYTTLPIYPGLGQAPNMLACIASEVPSKGVKTCFVFLSPVSWSQHYGHCQIQDTVLGNKHKHMVEES